MSHIDSCHARKHLKVGDKTYVYYSLRAAEAEGLDGISRLPKLLVLQLQFHLVDLQLVQQSPGLRLGAGHQGRRRPRPQPFLRPAAERGSVRQQLRRVTHGASPIGWPRSAATPPPGSWRP